MGGKFEKIKRKTENWIWSFAIFMPFIFSRGTKCFATIVALFSSIFKFPSIFVILTNNVYFGVFWSECCVFWSVNTYKYITILIFNYKLFVYLCVFWSEFYYQLIHTVSKGNRMSAQDAKLRHRVCFLE